MEGRRTSALHVDATCCMLQLLCLLVHVAADLQRTILGHSANMVRHLEHCKALRLAGIGEEDSRMINSRKLFSDANTLKESAVAKGLEGAIFYIGMPLPASCTAH